jgi:hypothetical protein
VKLYKVKLLKKVVEGSIGHPGSGFGWLELWIEMPFPPVSGLGVSFPNHQSSTLPSWDSFVDIDHVSWSVRAETFTCICVTQYLIDLLKPDEAETDLLGYLEGEVERSWGSFLIDSVET